MYRSNKSIPLQLHHFLKIIEEAYPYLTISISKFLFIISQSEYQFRINEIIYVINYN